MYITIAICKVGQFWVIIGSPRISLMGHWVIQINKCNPVATLMHIHT